MAQKERATPLECWWVFVLLGIIICNTIGVSGQTGIIYVSPTAASGGDGSQSLPFSTVVEALAAAANSTDLNTTIFLEEGTHVIDGPLRVSMRYGLNIAGDPSLPYGSRPVLSCSSSNPGDYLFSINGTVNASSAIQFQWLVIDGCNAYTQSLITINTLGLVSFATVDITNSNCNYSVIEVQGIPTEIDLLGCTFFFVQNSRAALLYYGSTGIRINIWNGLWLASGPLLDISNSTGACEVDIFYTWVEDGDCDTNATFVVLGNYISSLILEGDTEIDNNGCSGVGHWGNITIDQSQIYLNDGIGFDCSNGTGVFSPGAVWQNGVDMQCSHCNIKQNATGAVICSPTSSTVCPPGLRLDRCLVCGGNDTCINCNGQPYGTQNIFCNVTQLSLANTSLVGFNGNSPDAIVTPLIATQKQSDLSVTVHFISLTEIKPDGSVAQSYDLAALPFYPSGLRSKKNQVSLATVAEVNFTKYFTNSDAFITVKQQLANKPFGYSFNGFNGTVPPATLKFTFSINNWEWIGSPPDGTGGRLDLIVNFDGTQEVLSSQESTRTLLGGYQETDLLLFTQDTVQKMSWFNFAEFRLHNGSALQLGIINFTLIESNSAANNYTFLFSFYGPFKTVEYDPNLSIVIQPSNGAGDGGDGGKTLGLAIGLSVGITLAIVVVVAVIAIGVVVVWLRRSAYIRRSRSNSSNVNY